MPGEHQQVAAGRERRLLRGGCLGAGLLWCTGGGPGRAGRRRGRRCRGRRRRPGWRSPRGGGRGARRRAGGVHSAAGAARTSPGRRAWRVVRRRRALRRACPDALVGGGGRGGRDGGGRWQRRGGAIGRDGGAAGWCCKPWRGRGGARRGTAGAGGWTVWLRVVQAGGSVPDTVAEATLAPWRGGACGWLAGPAAPLGPGGGTGPVWLRVCCDAPLRRRTDALCTHAGLVRQEGGRFFAARTYGASLHAPPRDSCIAPVWRNRRRLPPWAAWWMCPVACSALRPAPALAAEPRRPPPTSFPPFGLVHVHEHAGGPRQLVVSALAPVLVPPATGYSQPGRIRAQPSAEPPARLLLHTAQTFSIQPSPIQRSARSTLTFSWNAPRDSLGPCSTPHRTMPHHAAPPRPTAPANANGSRSLASRLTGWTGALTGQALSEQA